LPVGGKPDEDEVNSWDELVDGATYEPVCRESLEEQVKGVRNQLRHLTNRQEDEVGTALVTVAAAEEGVPTSCAVLLPEERVRYKDTDTDAEVDAVVKVDTAKGPVLYIASHKTYSNGKR